MNPGAPIPTAAKTCAECRHHATYKRPRVADATGFDDQIEFHDDDETVYLCKAPLDSGGEHAGKEVGLVPITCAAWAAVRKDNERLAELDAKLAAYETRMKGKVEK